MNLILHSNLVEMALKVIFWETVGAAVTALKHVCVGFDIFYGAFEEFSTNYVSLSWSKNNFMFKLLLNTFFFNIYRGLSSRLQYLHC